MLPIPKSSSRISTLASWNALAIAIVVGSGCSCRNVLARREACAEPKGAIPSPVGTSACRWQVAQAAAADQDQFTVYQNEWLDGGDQLGPAGMNHVRRIAGELPQSPLPTIVEPSGNSELDARRIESVTQLLAQWGVGDAGSRVVVASPAAEPLYGVNAPRVAQGYSGSRGRSGSSSGMGGSGLGSGSSGGMGGGGFF